MSKKKRLFAICVAMLTIPAFTMGDAPCKVTDIADQAFAISAETIPTRETYVANRSVVTRQFDLEKFARATTQCGTEEHPTSEEATVMILPTDPTEIVATILRETQEKPRQDISVKAVAPVEKTTEHEDPTEPTTETETETTTDIETETVADETETIEGEISEDTDPEMVEEETEEATGADEFVWEGKKLTKSSGIVPAGQTPTGLQETWYNLPMFGCLDLLNYSHDGYAVNEQGFKTYNGYIMVATPDLNKYPKGTLVPTTNGMGIVVDFCPAGNLDIAVNW